MLDGMGINRARVGAALFLSVSVAAIADEPPVKPEAVASAEVEPDAAQSKPFKPPPGFKPKKHGDVILYCRREAVLGSRFPAEKCYDKAGLHAIKLAELEQKEMLERMRACSGASCSTN
jgi:hypothetical protein